MKRSSKDLTPEEIEKEMKRGNLNAVSPAYSNELLGLGSNEARTAIGGVFGGA